MSYYQFQPLLCFNARCWWQAQGRIDCHAWPEGSDALMPIWSSFDSGDRDDGWIRSGALPPRDSAGVVCDTLWFGVYRLGEQYVYDIRPAYSGATLDLWPQLERVLDGNIDGYLGFYAVPVTPYVWQDPRAPLWQIEGLEPAGLKPGARRCNLGLFNPNGKAVRLISDFTRSYLNDWKGVRGALALQVQEVPVPPHPRPQP